MFRNSSASRSPTKNTASNSIRPAQVPKITLNEFCHRFQLTSPILEKLEVMKVTGPHALRFVTDTHLVELGKMEIGEIADVRDAEERWAFGTGKE